MNELFVVFRVGESEYAVPAAEVMMMESWEGATRVPGAPPWVAGLVQIRGEVIPVVDLRARFGLDPVEPTLDTRVVVVREGDRNVGLKVDLAREVTRIDRESIEQPPEEVKRAARFVRGVSRVDKRLLMIIDGGSVVGEEKFDAEQR